MIWCLHGAFGAAEDWSYLREASALASLGLRAVDLWREDWPDGLWPWAQAFAAEVEQADDAPILLGYSLGGRLALHALLAAPGLWRAAILVSTHPGLATPEERAARAEADAAWLEKLRSWPWPTFWAAWDAQPIFGGLAKPPPARRETMSRALDSWSLAAQDSLAERLGELTCRTLWLAGEHDLKFRQLAEHAARATPHALLHLAGGCQHRVPWQDPAFADRVAEFARCPQSS